MKKNVVMMLVLVILLFSIVNVGCREKTIEEKGYDEISERAAIRFTSRYGGVSIVANECDKYDLARDIYYWYSCFEDENNFDGELPKNLRIEWSEKLLKNIHESSKYNLDLSNDFAQFRQICEYIYGFIDEDNDGDTSKDLKGDN